MSSGGKKDGNGDHATRAPAVFGACDRWWESTPGATATLTTGHKLHTSVALAPRRHVLPTQLAPRPKRQRHLELVTAGEGRRLAPRRPSPPVTLVADDAWRRGVCHRQLLVPIFDGDARNLRNLRLRFAARTGFEH